MDLDDSALGLSIFVSIFVLSIYSFSFIYVSNLEMLAVLIYSKAVFRSW